MKQKTKKTISSLFIFIFALTSILWSTPTLAVEGQNLEIRLEILGNNEKITEGQIITYCGYVKNTGTENIESVDVVAPIPAGTEYVVYNMESDGLGDETEAPQTEDGVNANFRVQAESGELIVTLTDIAPQEEMNFIYTVRVKEIEGTEALISNTLRATLGESTYTSNEVSNTISEAQFSIQILENSEITVNRNDDLNLNLDIYNLTENSIENIILQYPVSNNIKIKEMYISRYNQETGETDIQNQSYTVENNIANIDIGTMEANGNVYLNMVVQTTGTETNPILHQFSIQGNNVPVHYSNVIREEIKDFNLEITQSSDSKDQIKQPGDYINYEIIIKNDGDADAENVVIEDVIPGHLELVEASYVSSLGNTIYPSQTEDGKLMIEEDIKSGTEVKINLVTKVKEDIPAEAYISNMVKLSLENAEDLYSNEIANTLNNNQAKQRNMIILGVVLGVILLAGIGVGIFFFKKHLKNKKAGV